LDFPPWPGIADQEQALKTLARHFRFAALAVIVVGLVAVAATPLGIRLFSGLNFIGATRATLLLIGRDGILGNGTGCWTKACAPPVIAPGVFSNLLGAALLFWRWHPGVLPLRESMA